MPNTMKYGDISTRAVDYEAECDIQVATDFVRSDKDERKVYSAVISAQNLGDRIDKMDVESRFKTNPIVLFGHDREKPIGNALNVRRERDTGAWVSDFVFADKDPEAARIQNLWSQGTLRATSIGFSVRKDTPILHEFSIVPIGLDEKALARDDESIDTEEIEDMTDKEDAREAPEQEVTEDGTAVRTRVVGDLSHGEPVQNRDANSDALDNWDGDEPPEIEVVGDSSDSDGFNDDTERSRTDVVSMERAELDKMVAEAVAESRRVSGLTSRALQVLPDGYDATDKDVHDILKDAVGRGVSELDERSIDYLEGRLDAILERRNFADNQLRDVGKGIDNVSDVMSTKPEFKGIQDVIRYGIDNQKEVA